MSNQPQPYQYLARKLKSVYKQLFVKGRRIAARTLYGRFVSETSPMTVEEIAADYELPVDAVREAIAYCESDPPEIRQDWEREEEVLKATGRDEAHYDENPYPKLLTAEEMARLNRL